jgi:hypothetical protein
MAYSITNVTNPFTAGMWDAAKTAQNADVSNVTNAQTTVDLGSASYKSMRAVFYFKSFGTLTTGDVVTVTIQVGTSTNLTTPKNIIMVSKVILAADTTLEFQVYGVAQAFFESYAVTVVTSSNHTVTYDYQIDVA